MAETKITVSTIRKIDQLLDLSLKDSDIPLRPASLDVYFDPEGEARLDSEDPDFAHRSQMLTELHRVGLPVYVEQVNGIIKTLHMPLRGHVLDVFRDPADGITFDLDNSARSFAFRLDTSLHRRWMKIIQHAQLTGELVAVTENADGDVQDVRPWRTPPAPVPPAALTIESAPQAAPFRPVTWRRVQQMFDLVAGKTCCPQAPAQSCIPFLFPDDGCHARAHEMCRLITHAGEEPAKIWNFCRDRNHPLVFQTPTAVNCEVKWRFHVAVTLQVKESEAKPPYTVVIDPALSKEPITVVHWQRILGDMGSCLLHTSAVPYLAPFPKKVTSDEDHAQTEQELAYYRQQLINRVYAQGPPPYC